MLSHLLKRRMKCDRKLVLNVAERGSCTREHVLSNALSLATSRAVDWQSIDAIKPHVVFIVQNPRTEPLHTVSDYSCWWVQRVFLSKAILAAAAATISPTRFDWLSNTATARNTSVTKTTARKRITKVRSLTDGPRRQFRTR